MATTSFENISLSVSNRKRSKQFYRNIPGFSLLRVESMGPSAQWIQLAPAEVPRRSLACSRIGQAADAQAPGDELGAAAEARVWHRDRGLCPLRWQAEGHRIEEPEVIAKILAHLEKTAPDQSQTELPRGARAPPVPSQASLL